MARRRQTRKPKYSLKFRGLRTATLVLAGILVWLTINSSSLVKFIKAYHKRNAARDNVENLEQTVRDLETQSLSLKLGTFENEKSVREAYRLVKPGERLILLRTKQPTKSSAPEANGGPKKP